MKPKKFSISKISRQLKNAWTPINVAKVDNFLLKIAKFEGSYYWHQHENNDELFIVFKGKIKIKTGSGSVVVNEGEGVKIPKGVGHCPVEIEPSIVLVFENSELDNRKNKNSAKLYKHP